jgi:glyoxylase-like metal-dependent hydrolase (beta-lactamase superfamily II)
MEQIGANVFVETVYPGVNVGCIVTDQGSICIDTPLLPAEAQRWRTRVASLGGEPVRFVVYTNGQRERILGTQYLIGDSQGTVSRPATLPLPGQGQDGGKGTVVAHRLAWAEVKGHCTDSFKQSMIEMLAHRDPDIFDLEIILPHITLDASLKLYLGDEVVALLAAARGMLWVWFPKQAVLFAGDTVVVGTHPPLTVTDTREWLAALARLRRERRFQEAVIVPGRGPLCDMSATEPLTEYLRLARDRTRRLCRAGRPKADLNRLAADLVPLYPVADGQRERVQRQIKMGLDELYDEFKATDAADSEVSGD